MRTLSMPSEPSAVHQAYDALMAFVEAAPDGGRLPGERQLAKSLGVSRSTLRTATDRLVRLGLLEVRQGAGTIVRRPAARDLRLPYREALGRFAVNRDQLFELRRILEPRLAALAAGRRRDDEAHAISALAESEGAAFYEAVARASGNTPAADLVGLLADLSIGERSPVPGPTDGSGPEILLKRQRAVIASAITHQDAATSRETMVSHLRTLQRGRNAKPTHDLR